MHQLVLVWQRPRIEVASFGMPVGAGQMRPNANDDASMLGSLAATLLSLLQIRSDPVIGRDRPRLSVSCRFLPARKPFYPGRPGVGKTAIGQGLAQLGQIGQRP